MHIFPTNLCQTRPKDRQRDPQTYAYEDTVKTHQFPIDLCLARHGITEAAKQIQMVEFRSLSSRQAALPPTLRGDAVEIAPGACPHGPYRMTVRCGKPQTGARDHAPQTCASGPQKPMLLTP